MVAEISVKQEGFRQVGAFECAVRVAEPILEFLIGCCLYVGAPLPRGILAREFGEGQGDGRVVRNVTSVVTHEP
jgi:hypothetical protein